MRKLIISITILPNALIVPIIYFISIMYVLLHGWFAWALYTIIHLIVTNIRLRYKLKMFLLGVGVFLSVLFAFEMLEVLHVEENIWNSGGFLLFPASAMVAGWISLSFSKIEIWQTRPESIKEMMGDMNLE